ncbi:MAG TPA: hypothetical protein VF746_14180 [Longimicrobium sp.]|jgi:hypothetical protein
MYRHCIYCSADLGANEALEGFPVGRTLAFDAAKGRLWAVCRKCARWNLAPIEERWEAVEGAERLFRDTRTRVHAENIGVAKLRDGTRLVRIGEALPGELAVWRYGRELERRRFRAQAAAGMQKTAVGLVVVGSAFLGPFSFLSSLLLGAAHDAARRRAGDELLHVVHVVPPRESPSGQPLALRSGDLDGAYLSGGPGPGEVALHVPVVVGAGLDAVELRGEDAWKALSRALVRINGRGASRAELDGVFQMFARHGSLQAFLARQAESGATFGRGDSMLYWQWRARREGIPPGKFLAWQKVTSYGTEGARGHAVQLGIEIVLQEERERRALEGELKLLESAWREAEELASIADRLAGETPEGAAGRRLVPRRDPA